MKFNYKLEIIENIEFRYRTKIYQEITEDLIIKQIPQKPFRDALEWFFHKERSIPLKEKSSIQKIQVLEEDRIFVVYASNQYTMFKKLKYIAENTGWYFYITGVPLKNDEITDYINRLPNLQKQITLNWDISSNFTIELIPIASIMDKNSFLLKIYDKNSKDEFNILIDAGCDQSDILFLKGQAEKIDLIFVSHAHRDHTRGVHLLIKKFRDVPIVSSRTTFEFFVLYNWYNLEFREDQRKIDLFLKNWYFVKNMSIINLNDNCKISFFYAGHMAGALMLYLNVYNFKFLYTGDFTFYDSFPIAGVINNLNYLPEYIDFALVDGSFASTKYEAPSHIFNNFKDKISKGLKFKNRFLILADYGSNAMVFFFTLFRYFRNLQMQQGLNAIRPNIYMTDYIKRFFQIMSHNRESLHPYLQDRINDNYNPFQSAIIKWLKNKRDLQIAMERGGIFLLHDANLNYWMTQEALDIISRQKNNTIYLCGSLRNKASIELVSGNDIITLSNRNGSKKIKNYARIWNRLYPDITLNLHADKIQIGKLLDKLKPKKVCFFHQNPRKLIKIRSELVKSFQNMETSAIYGNIEDRAYNKIILYPIN